VHVRPLASADMVRALSLQVARLQSSRLAQLRGERIADPSERSHSRTQNASASGSSEARSGLLP